MQVPGQRGHRPLTGVRLVRDRGAMGERTRLHLATAGLVTVLVATGCSAEQDPGFAEVLTGQAHSADGAISIETGEWTYAVPLDGVQWVDAEGVWHDNGRPECLPPAAQPLPVTFAAVEVTIEGTTWRPVVWVDCQS